MLSDYDYYLLGCRWREIDPMSRWRFTVAHGVYQRMLRWKVADWRQLEPRRRGRIVLRWNRSRTIESLVSVGKQVAARTETGGDTGAAGSGDREPRVPRSPVLAGCGARPLPRPDDVPRPQLWA